MVEKVEVPFPEQKPSQIVVKVRNSHWYCRCGCADPGVQVKYGGVNTIDTYFRCVVWDYV